jgi:hypothetical protein
MRLIRERVAYLKGLAEGMQLNDSTNEGKIIKAMIEVLDDIALSVDDLTEAQQQLEEQVDDILTSPTLLYLLTDFLSFSLLTPDKRNIRLNPKKTISINSISSESPLFGNTSFTRNFDALSIISGLKVNTRVIREITVRQNA